LFRATVPAQPGSVYSPSPDGQRFLVIYDTTPPPPPVIIVVNWKQLLNAK